MKTAHFTLGFLAVLPAAAAPRPNVLWIMTDQHSYDAMSCAGNPHLHTPNIDRLASAGVLFPNTYCSFPLSGPSRAAMFTGYMPSETGMVENEMPLRDSLRNDVLGEIVARSGYDCVYAGKWHVNTVSLPSEHSFGFRRLHPMGDEGLAESCVSYLEGRKEGDAPFFLVASFVNPHNICEAARHQILPDADIEPSPKAKRPPLPRNFRVNRDDASVLRFEKGRNYALYPSSDFSRDDWREYRDSYYDMLIHGDYPPQLKRRILDEGHLSNDDAAAAIKSFCSDNLRNLFLCHLSGNNNTPRLAYDCARSALVEAGAEEGRVSLRVLPRGVPSPVVNL